MARLVVAARAKEFSTLPFDAFAARQKAIVRTLICQHEVHLLLFEQAGALPTAVPHMTGLASVRSLRFEPRPSSRFHRIAHMAAGLREPKFAPWEQSLFREVRQVQADAAVTLGPWLGEEFRAIHRAAPSLHFFEEDLTAMRDNASQSRQARLLRSLSRAALGRRRYQPRVVAAIGTQELPTAMVTYRRAAGEVLPLTLDPREWPLAEGPSDGTVVLVVGVMSSERNAEGLAAVLERVRERRLTERLRFRVVTTGSVHPILSRHLEQPWVDAGPERRRIYDEYRSARCALVPALRATGVKTTILQAWAAGCPVVCSTVCAKGVGGQGGDAVLAGNGPDEMIDALMVALESDAACERLVGEGHRRLLKNFDRSQVDRRLLEIVNELTLS